MDNPATEMNMENQVVVEQREGDIGINLNVPIVPSDVLPLNWKVALASLPEEEQKEILELASKIDVKKIENVMLYGSVHLKNTFDQCGDFLKDERGSQADQAVIAQVIELSKKATNSYDDFNLELKEPNFFQKLFLKLTSKKQSKSRAEKIQRSAVSNYKLLGELKASCNSWLEMLKKAMGDTTYSVLSDAETISLLEKYIIAGYIAEERIEREIANAKSMHEETGLMKYSQEYDELKEGYDIFLLTMSNLEKSRAMYKLSLGQLALIKRSNRNVQITINTQVNNTLALLSQQLRNAVLNAKTQEVLEGQKALTRLNDEVIKEVSKTIGITAEQAEKLLYTGVYNAEAAKEAITTVINSCNAIKKTADEMLPKMKADVTHINNLIEELEPCIMSITNRHQETTLKNENTSQSNTSEVGKLEF